MIKNIVSNLKELRIPCQIVEKHDKINFIIQDLKDTLITHPTGLGLSANQIGYNKGISYLRIPKSKTEFYDYIFINPKIIEKIGKTFAFKEGCLSFKGITVTTGRYMDIIVEFYDENFEKKTGAFNGIEAVVAQHEIQHLEGKTIFDCKWKAR